MQVRTVSVSLSATRDVVFAFLADIENLPKWAAGFCERIELRRHGWLAYTAQGDLMMEADTDNRTGVIDFRLGPPLGEFSVFPLRVMSLFEEETLVSFTFIQPPAESDELFERQYQTWLTEIQGLIRRFGGGELHAPGDAMQLGRSGLN